MEFQETYFATIPGTFDSDTITLVELKWSNLQHISCQCKGNNYIAQDVQTQELVLALDFCALREVC